MEIFASLMKGYTPILIFIFLCFASLLVMFMKLLRSLEEMLHGLSGDRSAVVQQLVQIKEQLELLARQLADSDGARKTAPSAVAGHFYAPSAPSAPPPELTPGPAADRAPSEPSVAMPLPSGSFPGDAQAAGRAGAPWAVAATAAVAGAAVGAVAAGAMAAAAKSPDEITLEEAEQAATEELVFSMDERKPPPSPAAPPVPKVVAPIIDLGDVDLAETLDLSRFSAEDADLSFDMEESELSFAVDEEEHAAAPAPQVGGDLEFDLGGPVITVDAAAESDEIDLLSLDDIQTAKPAPAPEPQLSFDSNLFIDDDADEHEDPLEPVAEKGAFTLDDITLDDSSDDIDIDLGGVDDKELDLLVEDLVDLPDEPEKDRKRIAEEEAPYEEAEVILDDDEPETELDILLDAPEDQATRDIEFSLDMEPEDAGPRGAVEDLQIENLELLTEKDLVNAPQALRMPAAPKAPAVSTPEMVDNGDIDLLNFTAEELITPQSPRKAQTSSKAPEPKAAAQTPGKPKESTLVDFILDE